MTEPGLRRISRHGLRRRPRAPRQRGRDEPRRHAADDAAGEPQPEGSDASVADLVDCGLDRAIGFLDNHQERLLDAALRPRRFRLRRVVDREVGKALIRGVRDLFEDLRDKDGASRARLFAGLLAFAAQIAEMPRNRGRISRYAAATGAQPRIEALLGGLWEQGRDALLRDLASAHSAGREAVALMLVSLSQAVLADAALARRLDAALEAAVAAVPWRTELMRFVTAVVEGWDMASCSDRIELAIGRDPQYIRVIDTLVGGGVGCAAPPASANAVRTRLPSAVGRQI